MQLKVLLRGSLAALREMGRYLRLGLCFSAHACTLLENYVDKEWAAQFKG